jgi:hypothetical protein
MRKFSTKETIFFFFLIFLGWSFIFSSDLSANERTAGIVLLTILKVAFILKRDKDQKTKSTL